MGRDLVLKQVGVSTSDPGSQIFVRLHNYLTKLGAVDPLASVSILQHFAAMLTSVGADLVKDPKKNDATFLVLDGRYIAIKTKTKASPFFDTENDEDIDALPKPPLLMMAISLNQLWILGE